MTGFAVTILIGAALAGALPTAFLTADMVLLGAAGVAGAGAVLAGLFALRARRRRSSAQERSAVRRVPSPSSLGMADDPIVAALGVGARTGRRPGRRRGVDRSER